MIILPIMMVNNCFEKSVNCQQIGRKWNDFFYKLLAYTSTICLSFRYLHCIHWIDIYNTKVWHFVFNRLLQKVVKLNCKLNNSRVTD